MVWLAIDDTDSRAGGCTTHVAADFITRLDGLDLIGPPRLVRLNPNVPHRTRGNGAVAVHLGHGVGPARAVGRWRQRALVAYDDAEEASEKEAEQAFDLAVRCVAASARVEASDTHPGVVMARRSPGAAFYREAVHRYVSLREADEELGRVRARWAAWKLGRGRLGAVAALGWPGRIGTFEAIAYRPRERWGKRRLVPLGTGAELDARFPATFDNWDPAQGHLRIAPSTPCPVLVGVRATDASSALAAAEFASRDEGAEGCLLFWTNQATDDHRRLLRVEDVRPFVSARIEATVLDEPVVRPGGHVFVRIGDDSGALDVAAYEPTRGLRDATRGLRPGDTVRVHGGVHEDPTLLALERLDLLAAPPRRRRRAPACGGCGRRMSSRGAAEGYRCPRCGSVSSRPEWTEAPGPTAASHEVPPAVRRHLARPLRLGPVAIPT